MALDQVAIKEQQLLLVVSLGSYGLLISEENRILLNPRSPQTKKRDNPLTFGYLAANILLESGPVRARDMRVLEGQFLTANIIKETEPNEASKKHDKFQASPKNETAK